MMEETNLKENLGYMMSETPDFEEEFSEEEVTYRQHPAIANSDLKYLHSPKLFHLKKTLGLTEESSESQKTGTLIDEYLLSPDSFDEKFIMEREFDNKPTSGHQYNFVEIILDFEDPLNPTNDQIEQAYAKFYSKPDRDKALKLYTELKDYIDFQVETEGKTVYSQQDWNDLQEIYKNCLSHKWANRILFEPKETDEVLTHLQIVGVEYWGIKWKGELDRVLIDWEKQIIYNIDLKSHGTSLSTFPWYYYQKWNYKRQQALYKILLKDYILRNYEITPAEWTIETLCLVTETSPLFEIGVFPIPEEVLGDGEKELREAANTIKYYRENGWDQRKTYRENGGLEVVDWSEFRDDS